MTLLKSNTKSLNTNLLDFGNITEIISDVVSTENWNELQNIFNEKSTIIIVGHGGNLAVSDHISADITRLTNFKKKTLCPGSAILATSYINDTSFDDWLVTWFKSQPINPEDSLIIGISSSGKSKDIEKLFDFANKNGVFTSLITAANSSIDSKNQIVTKCSSYHSSELVALALGYQLVHGFGYTCPIIK